MKIGIFTDAYTPQINGVVTSVCTLKEELEKLGHEIFIITSMVPNYEDKEKNIIESHMFPLNIKAKPKYIESIIISIVDKIACIYEKAVGYTSEFNFKVGKATIYMLLFLNS